MLSLQRRLEIKSYRTVWTMGHNLRQAQAEQGAYYKLAGLIEMDDAYFRAPNPRNVSVALPARATHKAKFLPSCPSRLFGKIVSKKTNEN